MNRDRLYILIWFASSFCVHVWACWGRQIVNWDGC